MRHNILLPFITLALLFTACQPSDTEQQKQIKTIADQVADWQIANFTYRETGNLHDYGIDAWTNGVFYLGLSKWAEISDQQERYNNWLYHEIGTQNQWSVPANFLHHPAYSYYHADELCMSQFYLHFYEKYEETAMIEATQQRLDSIIAHPPAINMAYNNKKMWTWCDALFMAPPVYVALSHALNDDTYLHYMHQQFMHTYQHLYDIDASLFYRDDSYFEKREENGEKIFWGRGNGWVLAGVANIIDQLPTTDKNRDFYIELFRQLANSLVTLQHPDGFWHASLLDPESYPSPETSATALITYGLAYGINHGLLVEPHYHQSLHKAWSSLLTAIDESGKLGWVQPIGADPKKVTEEMTAVYGVGAFLLAASEMYQMK